MNYHHKYIKYKTKYAKLAKLTGGDYRNFINSKGYIIIDRNKVDLLGYPKEIDTIKGLYDFGITIDNEGFGIITFPYSENNNGRIVFDDIGNLIYYQYKDLGGKTYDTLQIQSSLKAFVSTNSGLNSGIDTKYEKLLWEVNKNYINIGGAIIEYESGSMPDDAWYENPVIKKYFVSLKRLEEYLNQRLLELKGNTTTAPPVESKAAAVDESKAAAADDGESKSAATNSDNLNIIDGINNVLKLDKNIQNLKKLNEFKPQIYNSL